MNKAKLLAGSAATAAFAFAGIAPAFAQVASGPFADVPTDHWAYASVDKLQKAGIVIGYPDGTYGGKRAMTRYEFAVAIARLLDKIQPNLSDYYTKEEADAKFATKDDLAGFATKEEVQTLRNLVDEFHTELTTLGVDLDATKKRLAALEGRVAAIEEEMKRVKVGGTLDFYGLGSNTTASTIAFRDQDGFVHIRGNGVGEVGATNGDGNLLAAAQVLNDVDLTVKARLSSVATAETNIVFGNYESYLGSLDSLSGNRSAGGSNEAESVSVYSAFIKAPVALPGLGGTTFTVGRIPFQLTDYTFKQIDVDDYFYNDKTDLGNIPIDGATAQFNLGPIGITGVANEIDPIQFVSADGSGAYGVYAGAAHGAYGPAGSVGGFGNVPRNGNPNSGYGRPSGQTIAPDTAAFGAGGVAGITAGAPGGLQGNGAMLVNQDAGARITFGSAKTGTLGATYIEYAGTPAGTVFPGTSNLEPDPAENGTNAPANGTGAFNLNRVIVYGADLNSTIFGLGLKAAYTKSDTAGATNDSSIDTSSRITKHDDAFDGALSYTASNWMIGGGYRDIAPYFGAPGYWDHVGTLTDPVDIEGPYAKLRIGLGKSVSLQGEGQFYQGTGDAVNDGGLSNKDKITNFRAGIHFGLTSASNVDLGAEVTQYKIGVDEENLGIAGKTPEERFYNIGYGYSFNPSSSFKLLYQIINYDDKDTGFDPLGSQNAGIAAAEFQVKF